MEGCGGRCGGLERIDFEQFLLWDGVVFLKELILNSFNGGGVVFMKALILGQCGGLQRTELEQFLLWNGVEVGVVLKVLILNRFYFGRVWWTWKI